MLSEQLTIVIPTSNEQGYIGRLLHDLVQQHDITGTKVIIADSSTDTTLEVVENFKNKYFDTIDIEVIEGGTPSIARNRGAELATTPFILFINADIRLPDTFHIIQALTEAKVIKLHNTKALVTSPLGSYVQDWKCKVIYDIYNFIHRKVTRLVPFTLGVFFLIDKESYIRYNNFNIFPENPQDLPFLQHLKPSEFRITKEKVLLDDRRFKKIGYFGIIKHLLSTFYKYIRTDKKDIGISE